MTTGPISSQDDTIVSLGMVLKLELEKVKLIKEFCRNSEIKICYQLVTVERLRVVKEKDLLSLEERAAGP